MINTNKIAKTLIPIWILFFSCISMAGVASIFDDPYLVTLQVEDSIRGYYASENDRFSCMFLFTGSIDKKRENRADLYNATDIKTFSFFFRRPKFKFEQRDKDSDIPGKIYVHENDFILKTTEPQGGCNGVAGLFNAGPNEAGVLQYSVKKKINAIGISIVTRKTFFFNKVGSGKRKGFLVVGNIVLIISRRNGYSYVQFTNPNFMIANPGETTTGWVKTNDLENPFPPSRRE